MKLPRLKWANIAKVDGAARRSALKKSLWALPALPFVFNKAAAAEREPAKISNTEPLHAKDKISEGFSSTSVNGLRQQDGLKFIGQALSVDELKKIVPDLPGQRISLASWHRQGWGGLAYPAGGGTLYSVCNNELKEDGGTIFRVNDKWCWVRDISGEIDAQWFGVTGDGIARAENISTAIDYITHNGGILTFPKGEINFGLLRKRIEYFPGIKKFTIRGQGYETVFTFDNIDPPERKIDKNWVSEPTLILIKGRGTDEFIDSPIIENLTIDYTRQRNGGGTDLATLDECHPTPHSIGAIAIYAIYCRNPVFRNLRFANIYGSGIYCKKSFNPLSENLSFLNVSANQIIDRTGRMDRDNSGGAIFYWACYGGKITNCSAWNTRKYTVNYRSPDNKQELKDTLCGYIGFWCEFSVSRTDRVDLAPPMIDWLNVKGKELDRVSRGVEITNCIIYGYVIGIKGEAAVDISIVNNKVLNCYLPITCSGVRGVVQRNFTDMLGCDNIKCPQGGLEQKRSHLGGMTFTSKSTFNQSLDISHNYVRTRNYPAFTTSRLNLKFLYNYVNVYGKASLFNSVSESDFYGLEVSGNTFVIEDGAEPQDSILSSNETSIFSSNTFDNKSKFSLNFIFLPGNKIWHGITFNDNYFNGPIKLQFKSKALICGNRFIIPRTYTSGVISLHGNGSQLNNNYFTLNSNQEPKSIFISAIDVMIGNNQFYLIDNGKPKTHGVLSFDDSCISPKLQGNRINDDKYGISLAVAGTLIMPHMENNNSDGDGTLLWISKTLKGPVISQMNVFKGGLLGGESEIPEPNSKQNLWENYSPSTGQRITYLNPHPGGREGLVMTNNGWKEFGAIGE
ncbi:hypothetical protein ED28_14775 [[Pantoea] beijingensis]|uniref:Uncharacterized protein n=1 Tax=[Pantoea] beijingensis TaxID=1324864 RepID=A0A443IAL8_9GAMM|nr:hypothetical protein [[Pantoea] beijingensis]RWR01182.1 hypothetical protein ED28_14775 [[Pantoea] beijingensis]